LGFLLFENIWICREMDGIIVPMRRKGEDILEILHAIFLGLVQGLTEFIPVSSSGHLVITRDILGIQEGGLAFDVMLHVGTLTAVFAYYWKDLWLLAEDFIRLICQLAAYPFVSQKPRLYNPDHPHRVLLLMLMAGTVPTALIGFLFNDLFQSLFESVYFVGYTLLITGSLVWVSNRMLRGRKQMQDMRLRDALVVGLFQGLAITPGVSRSGSTIFAGLSRGFNRELATRFSFLLSIPAILGAVVLEGKDVFDAGAGMGQFPPILVGFLVSALSGYCAIRFLIKLISQKKLHYFSYYTWTLGLCIILYSIFV
jgi:undecaprenyl-diphosphatase